MVMLEDAPLSTRLRRGRRARSSSGVLERARRRARHGGDGLERFEGDGERVERVVTESGRELDADVVVMGTGAVPDVMLAARRRAGARRDAAAWPATRDLRDVGRRRVGGRRHLRVRLRAARRAACGSSTGRSPRRRARRPRRRCSARDQPLRRGAVLLVRPRRLGDARVRRARRATWDARGRARLDRRRRVRGLATSRRPRRRRAVRRALGRPRAARGGCSPRRADVGERATRSPTPTSRRSSRARRTGATARAKRSASPRGRRGRSSGSCARGGSPRSSHPPSGRRSISPRAISWPERRRDRRAAGADHAGERAVREAQRDEHAAGHHAAPALGQAPQQRQQAVVDAGEVRDRLHHDEPLGAAGGAVHERGEDLGPLRGPHGQRLVDDREPRVASSAVHSIVRGSRLLGVAVVPGAQEVARAEQLGARVVADGRLADEQAVEHQQADRLAAAGSASARGVQRPRGSVDRADEEPLG